MVRWKRVALSGVGAVLVILFVLLPFVVAWNLLHPARNQTAGDRSLFIPTK